ncbi:oxidoreductase [Alkalihalobacillus alcalophilus ATCC 27647 = CGMCC 1.3604]|uniref:Oxidoreductase n=1 Tax=Alkalihalobacillus alcalophilus ATCC 27647 = CGMCC 1.3604 TaxID=1218173 RepID=A0A094WRE8_ALKAL|nr:Gfo/Idh/MocA family oxidoreductase [Alkalihalobacillus alcalophilus]KGA98633.1 oxidoreductase [Alkalihalobacillus alcalophilus ATCC 27647 = CGMCC 1.3604]MED1562764.1 Gfo/Idh/MocA family oxidoreductase [Alkalihalobacillus alcalophilus]THG89641.1 oxidoreductase [Alkalihalobacillus alcalophilus ATCC 27647 = CGMCC 1.3604]
MKKNDVIKVGLIGLGGMSNAHRHFISEIDELQLVAICDVNQEQLNKVGELERIGSEKRFQEIEDLIANPDVEAIVSVVPNNLHAKVIELCIRYQKPLMTEKPFTLNFEEAEKLAVLYEKQPIPCMVGFSYRYIPSFRYARNLIKENKIGTIRHVDIRYLQSGGAALFESPYAWRFNKASSGTGALGDLGAHMIDSARFLIGEFRSVSALMGTFIHERRDPISGEMKKVDVDDYASFQAILENNVLGNFVTSRNAIGSGNQHEVMIYGDYGTIHINCERPDEIELCIKEENEVSPSFRTKKVPELYRKQQWQDFLDLVKGNQQEGTPTFYDGYQNQKVLEQIIESAER